GSPPAQAGAGSAGEIRGCEAAQARAGRAHAEAPSARTAAAGASRRRAGAACVRLRSSFLSVLRRLVVGRNHDRVVCHFVRLLSRDGQSVVVTGLQANGWDAGDRVSVPEGAQIVVADVGTPAGNLAVTAVRPQPDRVSASVLNASPRARDARVHLTIDNRPAGDATVSLGANQSGEVLFAGAPRGAAAAVAVEDPTGIQADNVRFAVLGGTSKPSVLVVTGTADLPREAFYVQQALAAGTSAPGADQP